MFNPWQNGQEKSTPGLSATGQTKGLERHNTSGLSRTRCGVQCEPTERLDYVVVPEKLRLSAAVGLGHMICVVKIARKDVIQGQNLAI